MKNYFLILVLCSPLLFDYQGRPTFLNYSEFKQTTTSLNELLKINLYSDKTVLQEGDSLLVIVEIANLSQDTLQVLDLKFVSLEFSVISNPNCPLLIAPASSEVCEFYLKAKKLGTSNLIAKATVKKLNSAANSKSVTVIKQFEHIQIISLAHSSKEPKGSFDWISLLLGALLGYVGNIVANIQTHNSEITKNKENLLDNLRNQLEAALQSIKDNTMVKTQWLDENFFALVSMSKAIAPERDISVELKSLRESLHQYNENLERQQIDAERRISLETKLVDIINVLPPKRIPKWQKIRRLLRRFSFFS